MDHHLWTWLGILIVVWALAIWASVRLKVRTVFGSLVFYGAVLCGCAALIFFGSACTKQPPAKITQAELERIAHPDPLDASIVIMANYSTWRFEDFPDQQGAGSYEVSKIPVCSAFTVRDSSPGLTGIKIVTASHCLHDAKQGSDVMYVDKDQWDHTSDAYRLARVTVLDLDHDRAVLSPITTDDAERLSKHALFVGKDADKGDSVHAVSCWFGSSRLQGRVIDRVGGASGPYYMTDLNVVPGWSGAPVLNEAGEVVGLLRAYGIKNTRQGSVGIPNSGIFVDLDGLNLQ